MGRRRCATRWSVAVGVVPPVGAKAGLLVLVILLGAVTRSAGNFSFPTDPDILYEGDKCGLPGMRTGTCQKAADCPQGIRANGARCEFSGNDPVVCCPTEAPGTGDGTSNRFTARIAKQECERFTSASANIIDHISGRAIEALRGEFPFVALVNFRGEEGEEVKLTRCGASLIAPRFLLTAAHCLKDLNPVTVEIGFIQLSDTEKDEYEIKQVHLHEGHKSRRNDIALIELKNNVTYKQDVGPICLNTDRPEIGPSINLTVMGWGADGDGQRADKLMKGTVYEIPLDECVQRFRDAKQRISLGEDQLCALGEKVNDETTDACQGDSGGPLVMTVRHKFYLVGVVSTGAVCGGSLPGIYTRVSRYLEWIEQRVWGSPN
ncbi:CLIP domain-containing serine protease C9-like isoform X1 [Anopheles gambiae]|uniref:Peptidase S1 domain-containing protein n=1 Tax=Anopheles coluzzii TaxID=1518534 RepID=A0A6E8V8T5_ANOCL|nr:CLIP domain-containing serine protease C9-like isoform X1 [Anopheles gambiae]